MGNQEVTFRILVRWPEEMISLGGPERYMGG